MALHNQTLDCIDLVCVCSRCSSMWLIIAKTVGQRETNSSQGTEGTEREEVIGVHQTEMDKFKKSSQMRQNKNLYSFCWQHTDNMCQFPSGILLFNLQI